MAGAVDGVRVDRCVLVTGAPGSGKTTLGRALAERLDVPFVGKDPIKEALFDSLGVGDLAWSKQCSEAATAILFWLLPELRTAVVECNFSLEHWEGIARILPAPVEVFCRVPPDVAVARFAARQRHDGHRDTERLAEVAEWVTAAEPLAVGPVLEVLTTVPVDIDAVARWIGSASL